MKKTILFVLLIFISATIISAQTNDGELVPYRKGDQWGFATRDKKIFIVPQHDEVFPFSNGYARVRNGTRYGIIDMKGRIIVPIAFDEVSEMSEGKFAVRQGVFPKCLSGYYDTTGKVAIPFRYIEAFPFQNGRAMVKVGVFPKLKQVFIDHNGNLTDQKYTATKYDMLGAESEERIRFREKGKWGYLNVNNEIAIKPGFEDASDFKEGMAFVKKDGKFGYIDKNGKTVIPFKYDMAGNFSNGVAIVYILLKTNDEFQSEAPKYGLINKQGK
jgi:hypothetical protein